MLLKLRRTICFSIIAFFGFCLLSFVQTAGAEGSMLFSKHLSGSPSVVSYFLDKTPFIYFSVPFCLIFSYYFYQKIIKPYSNIHFDSGQLFKEIMKQSVIWSAAYSAVIGLLLVFITASFISNFYFFDFSMILSFAVVAALFFTINFTMVNFVNTVMIIVSLFKNKKFLNIAVYLMLVFFMTVFYMYFGPSKSFTYGNRNNSPICIALNGFKGCN